MGVSKANLVRVYLIWRKEIRITKNLCENIYEIDLMAVSHKE